MSTRQELRKTNARLWMSQRRNAFRKWTSVKTCESKSNRTSLRKKLTLTSTRWTAEQLWSLINPTKRNKSRRKTKCERLRRICHSRFASIHSIRAQKLSSSFSWSACKVICFSSQSEMKRWDSNWRKLRRSQNWAKSSTSRSCSETKQGNSSWFKPRSIDPSMQLVGWMGW